MNSFLNTNSKHSFKKTLNYQSAKVRGLMFLYGGRCVQSLHFIWSSVVMRPNFRWYGSSREARCRCPEIPTLRCGWFMPILWACCYYASPAPLPPPPQVICIANTTGGTACHPRYVNQLDNFRFFPEVIFFLCFNLTADQLRGAGVWHRVIN